MDSAGLTILTILMGCAFGVSGSCVHVHNDDMVEYACMGGHPSDLNAIPQRTEKIRIDKMLIPILSADVFSRFGENLWVLSCSHCGIMNIKADAFHRLMNLQHLSLDNNHLAVIRGVWFKGLDFLTYLDLNYNDIDTIEDDVFENLRGLVDLRLSGNRLQCLNLDAMDKLADLRRIFLGENKEFRCPNAVKKFLEDREISFEPDPEWRRMPIDVIRVPIPPANEYTDASDVARVASSIRPTHDHTTSRLPIFPTRSPVADSSSEKATEVSSTPPYPEHVFVTHPSREHPTHSRPESAPTGTTTSSPLEARTDSSPDTIILYPPYDPSTHRTPEPITYPLYTYPQESVTTYPSSASTTGASDSIASVSTTDVWDSPSRPEYPRYPDEATESSRLATADPPRLPLTVDTSDYFFHTESTDDETTTIATHVVRPYLPPPTPRIVQPSSPNDFFQTPYREPTVTIRPSHILESYQRTTEASTAADFVPMVTSTTDKPRPDCPSGSEVAFINNKSITAIVIGVVILRSMMEAF